MYTCVLSMCMLAQLVNIIEYLVNNLSALFTVGDHFNSLHIHFTTSDFG